jgi:tRNA (guanine-N7-)-methyltransferase
VDNPTRTACYQALVQQRRREIRVFLGRHLPPDAAFVWEVGCGHGHFLTAYALAHPEMQCVGVDISSDRIERAQRKRSRVNLPNLHFLQAEGGMFLEEMPAGLALATVFLLFPDPWPKLRHRKHRILRDTFLRHAAARTVPACRLCFRTDHLPYYREAAALLHADPQWEIATEPWPFECATVFQQRAPAHHSLIARRRA